VSLWHNLRGCQQGQKIRRFGTVKDDPALVGWALTGGAATPRVVSPVAAVYNRRFVSKNIYEVGKVATLGSSPFSVERWSAILVAGLDAL
jgi:hypothetical protein